jgi:hypothetical protein
VQDGVSDRDEPTQILKFAAVRPLAVAGQCAPRSAPFSRELLLSRGVDRRDFLRCANQLGKARSPAALRQTST